MKITAISFKIEKIPLKTPFITALRRVEHVENLRICVHTDTPCIGFGAAPATKAITGEDLTSIQTNIKDVITPQLLNEPFELSRLLEILHNSSKGNNSAKAAVDMALYDLAAMQKGQNLLTYLGAKTTPLKTALTISLNPVEKMVEEATLAYGRGYNILKVKLGGDDGDDLARIQAIRETLPEAKLLIDANQAWSVEQTLQIIKDLEPLEIELIEQPVKGDDIEGLRSISVQSPIPILADEAVFSLGDAKKVIAKKAAHLINIKLMKCGGISKAIEIIEYCQSKGVKCMMGSMLEGPTSIALTTQLVMAYKDAFSYIDLDSPLLYKKIPTGTKLKFFNNIIELEDDDLYSVYILKCADESYYTGIAKEVKARLDQHNSSAQGAKYTKARRPVKLLYEERHRSKNSALKREIEIKKLRRPQKEQLIKLQS